jgi:TPR repeat protein
MGLIIYVIVSGDRGAPEPVASIVDNTESTGTIERSLLVPPGMRAREYVAQLRGAGQPYPLDLVYEKAQKYLQEGSLADAHLLYFFAAREDYIPAIMTMGEMSDPTRFQAENSLLDSADVIQAYKWYQKAAAMGHQPATQRVEGLQQWASIEAEAGNSHARQLLLNFQQVNQ